jgi:hypothetical protein
MFESIAKAIWAFILRIVCRLAPNAFKPEYQTPRAHVQGRTKPAMGLAFKRGNETFAFKYHDGEEEQIFRIISEVLDQNGFPLSKGEAAVIKNFLGLGTVTVS